MDHRTRGFALLLLLPLASLNACQRSGGHGSGQKGPQAAESATAAQAGSLRPKTAQPERTAAPERREVAVLAGGCFWGMEELLRKQPGVIATTVGYAGGQVKNPSYGQVSSGESGHAEAVRIEFDPDQTSYEKILLYYFSIHDPTTQNRQGNDVGSQYRSAIFVQDDEQRRVAEIVKQKVAESGDWQGSITTEIVEAAGFYPAEEYHQDYLQKHPGGYTCHFERDVSFL